MLAPDGRRLSKRDGDVSLEQLATRYTPEQIVGRLAYACGLQTEPAPRTPAQLLPDFDWAKVPRQDICLPEGLFCPAQHPAQPHAQKRRKSSPLSK